MPGERHPNTSLLLVNIRNPAVVDATNKRWNFFKLKRWARTLPFLREPN